MKILVYVILAVLILVAGLRLFSRKLLYFPAPMEPGRENTLAGLTVAPLSLAGADGTTLAGWLIEKDMKHLPVIFYFGGNAEEVSWNVEAFLAQVPANVVLVNYRGYGQSLGKPTETALKADALAIFDTLANQHALAPDQCLAWGRSLGSSMAAWLVRQRHLGGLILTCPFDSIEAVAAGFYPGFLVKLVLPDPHRTTAFSSEIQAPVLILAAENDEIIPFERTKALHDSLGGPKRLEIIPRTGHNTISDGAGYYGAVADFLESLRNREK